MTSSQTRKKSRKNSRLRLNRDIRFVRDNARVVKGKYLVVQVAEAQDGCNKISIIVSRRFSKKAVQRNRAKRLIREALSTIPETDSALWMILRPRQYILNAKSQDVAKELSDALSRLNNHG
jgi:ribonuclease P protein component